MNDAVIELENVTKSYGGVIANHAISLTVERGAITGTDRTERFRQDHAV